MVSQMTECPDVIRIAADVALETLRCRVKLLSAHSIFQSDTEIYQS